MNKVTKLAALCAMALPAAAFAGGTATGTITSLLVDASYANVMYITVSGLKSGGPACSTSTRGQFVIPYSVTNDYAYMVQLATTAAQSGKTVTVTGQYQCNVDNNVETIQNINIG